MSKNCKNNSVGQQNSEEKKTDSKKEMSENFNRSYDWWSDTPQEWRNDEREESFLDPKWNRSLSNISVREPLSEVEEVTETLQRRRKIIRGGRRNSDSSDSETRIQSRVKWQLQPEQQKEEDSRLLSFWQLIGGESNTTKNNNQELVATSEETDKTERCSSNRGESDNHIRHGERPRGVRDRTTQNVQ